MRRWAAAVAASALLAASAVGEPPSETRPQKEIDGERLFRQAVLHVANGQPPVQRVKSFYADLEDVQWNLDGTHTEGALRLWVAEPDRYRFEQRTRPGSPDVTTKELQGTKMWVTTPGGRTKRMHGTPEGVRAIQQAREDRAQLMRLARFLAPQSLMRPNVKFVFQGARVGSGIRKGRWLQVDRVAPDGTVMQFFLAYEAHSGRVTRALYPGAVTIAGRAGGPETEHYLLSGWRTGRQQSLRPARIAAHRETAQGPKRFLLAHVRALTINEAVR